MKFDPVAFGKIRKSLNVSWKEGIPAQITLTLVDYYLVPFALFLGATPSLIGLLVAIPNLLASSFQLLAVNIVRRWGSRLRFLITNTSVQATLLIPIAVLAVMPFQQRFVLLIFLITIFRILGSLIATAWGSLMSDYLPAERRGRYFGWRSQIVGIAGVFGIGLGGILLFWMKKIHSGFGFCFLFLAAALCRFLSSYLMSKMADLPLRQTPDCDFTFYMFVRRFRESNFVKFVLYVASIIFTTNLAAPYFSVYMLRDLHFNYLTFMLINLTSVMSGLVAFPIWGKHADLVGNAKILKITGLMVPLVPILWLFTKTPHVLFVIELFSGFVWGGFNLCATNFIYDAVSPEKRIRCLGYFSLINGVAIFAGSSIGGFLAEKLPPLFGFSILTLFLISGALRFAAYFLLSKHFREVRESTRRISSLQLFFSVLGMDPLAGLSRVLNVFPVLRILSKSRSRSQPSNA